VTRTGSPAAPETGIKQRTAAKRRAAKEQAARETAKIRAAKAA